MTQVTIHETKTHLSRLIKLAIAGEEIQIAKGRTPLVRIMPLPDVHKELYEKSNACRRRTNYSHELSGSSQKSQF